jgi:hypothetical protein
MMLVVDVLATPKALAEGCRMQNRRTATWHPCCPFPAAACPIKMASACYRVQPEDWERVLQKEKGSNEDADAKG